LGYAKPASTAEDAKIALQARPKLMPSLYYSYRVTGIDAMIGKVYLLAGHPEEAIPHLTRAAADSDCSAVSDPMSHTVAEYHLGMAHEARNDKVSACAAYRVVLERWSAAKGSVTAKAAAARAKALDCSAP
jgi:hypothetical protein